MREQTAERQPTGAAAAQRQKRQKRDSQQVLLPHLRRVGLGGCLLCSLPGRGNRLEPAGQVGVLQQELLGVVVGLLAAAVKDAKPKTRQQHRGSKPGQLLSSAAASVRMIGPGFDSVRTGSSSGSGPRTPSPTRRPPP
eukprot:SAG22_NODE_8709_length_635_cov_1.578358_1_plen_137_part_10